jgi:hypothetical protein
MFRKSTSVAITGSPRKKTDRTGGTRVKPHSVFALLLVAVSVLAISLTGASSASRTDNGLTVSSAINGSKLDDKMTLSGQVTWTATSSGTPNRLEFLIDGTSKWTDSAAPYQFGGDPTGKFDTTSLGNGQHTLKVKAYPDSGGTHATTLEARVSIQNDKNAPPPPPPPPPPTSPFAVASSVADGSTLTGAVTWTATPSGTTVSSVDFLIDGTVKWTEKTSPYMFNGDPGGKLDTTTLGNGTHTLALQAHAADGRTASTTSTVTVANVATPPPTGSFVVTSSIANGAALTGSLKWTATPSGTAVDSVDFLIDGTLQWTEHVTPFQFNGDPDGLLDSTTLGDGPHILSVQAHAKDGRTATTTSSVTVKNGVPAAPTFVVVSSIADGATIGGSVVWTAAPSGDTVSKVEFSVDGTTKWTDPVAPYQYGGDPAGKLDTKTLTNGKHTLEVTAYGTDGLSVVALSSVTVSNAAAPPPAPSYGSIPRFGIATGYKILTRSATDQKFELDQIQSIGAKLVRFDSLPGNQSQVDTVVSGVLSRGMEPILVLFGTTGPISPSTAAAFASSQATKWKGRVRLYEFTNEPDLHSWTGTSYAKALIPVYNAIKAADPNAIVIAGALWTGAGGPVKFVSDMYDAGAKGHFDILSLHLYDDPFATGSWNIWNMAFHTSPSVRSVMDAHGDQNIPIGATEAGGPVTKYGESGQASIVGHDFDALTQDPRLAFVCVYSMMDDEVPGFGLLNPDRTKRQAWNVYASNSSA